MLCPRRTISSLRSGDFNSNFILSLLKSLYIRPWPLSINNISITSKLENAYSR